MASLELDALAPPGWGHPTGEFVPCARYYEAMDTLIYLEADLPYRADRVDKFLTLLWHPEKDEAIGVKLKGFRFLFRRLQNFLESTGCKLNDEHFPRVVATLEVAMTAGLGAIITTEAERNRLAEIEAKYEKARRLVKEATFDAREVAHAA
jgi:hypothetical protein